MNQDLSDAIWIDRLFFAEPTANIRRSLLQLGVEITLQHHGSGRGLNSHRHTALNFVDMIRRPNTPFNVEIQNSRWMAGKNL